MKKLLFLLSIIIVFQVSAQQSAKEVINKSEKHFKKKEYQEAMNVLNDGIIKMPDSSILYFQRGNLNLTYQRYDKAESDFTIGYKLTNDTNEKVLYLINRSSAKTSVRDFEGAYNDLIQAIKLDSNNIGAYSNLAYVTDELKKPDEAMTYYNKIIEIDPKFCPVYVNLGYRSQLAGKHELALKYFDIAVKLEPKEPLVYSNRSFSKLKTNDLKGARKDIEKSLKMRASNSYAYKIRALICIEEGNTKDACEDLFIANQKGYTEEYGSEVNELMRKHCN